MEQGGGRTDFCSLFYNAHAEVRISFLTLLQSMEGSPFRAHLESMSSPLSCSLHM